MTAPHPVRLLVVDDEPDIRDILSLTLGMEGKCGVRTAHDAKTALVALDEDEQTFDGIFLDIQMPGTTGIELCSIIRSTPGYGDVPIIMLTAMTERDYLREAFAKGADDYVTKPFNIDDLRKKFAKLRAEGFRRRPLKAESRAGTPGAADREVIRSLDDAAAIRGVERCVGRDAFQTYLIHSHTRFATPVSLRATKIGQVYDHFSRLPDGEYEAMVRQIAKVLSQLTERTEDVFTYFGNGIFLSSSIGKSALEETSLSAALERNKGLRALAKGGGSLNLILGNDVVLNGVDKADVIRAVTAAIESCETTEASMASWGTFQEWMSQRMSIGRERSRLEKSAYEQILTDFIDAGELGWK
jgi:CheY-like chemotaxis protein